ncbi:GNAT family N-acetyltransferase [Oleiagrimonas sp. MCCC 1A03011]|uniref:GNAT family N-acetyltransferase n=1 Tax=Oleiagrimonas sp. MCCC 1A03011 TaxID=1926883 RepID=UPI000DC3535D|nr:GNAT family N-acetyltransferase [Oleiagrimonas sp. MCCC 1A03011]RAP57376.1 GNAT family N-acetyltransferase [Oleiagrimonas sp. MCCC 1A03011]
MPHTLRIRQGLLDDLDTLAPLFDAYRRFYEQPADLDAARRFLHERLALRESVIFVAERVETSDNQTLGFTQLYPGFSSVAAQRLWILNDLFVIPEARGQGVGRALLERAREHAGRTGACRMTLSTANDNTGAQRLYEDVGYLRDTDVHYALPVP